MNNSTFIIVPAQGQEHLLRRKIAGLTLTERLCRTARKVGIDGVMVITSGAEDISLEGDSKCPVIISNERSLADIRCGRCIVLRPGYFPDVDFIKTLLSSAQPGKLYVLDGLPALFICDSKHFSYISTFFLRPDSFDEAFNETSRSHMVEKLHIKSGRLYNVTDESDVPGVEDALFQGLIKDTEGFMSRYVERKISIAISKRLVNTPVTPNQMTIFSVLVGIIGAYLISLGGTINQSAGALLFLAHSILDGCDGEIARIKFLESKFGGVLDFWGDNIVHAAVFYAIGHEWHERTGNLLPLILSWMSVFATFGSAGLVYFRTMRTKTAEEGPLFTSVSTSKRKKRITRIADFLSRRDFIYLVVILAFFNHLDWFLILTATGSAFFFLTLVWLYFLDSKDSKLSH